MNRASFLNFVQNPHQLDETTVDALSSIVADYPYFQAARMLLVKNLAVIDSLKYSSVLKNSAAFITHRDKLYDLVYSLPLFSELVNSEPVVESNVIEAIPVVVEKTDNITPLTPSVELDKVDYFEVSDVIELSSFAQVVKPNLNDSTVTFDFNATKNDQSELSIDLLDFENQINSVYSLEEELSVTENDALSFSDWLNKVSIQKATKAKEEKPKDEKAILINNFLKAKPKIIPRMVDVPNEDGAVKRIYDEPENLLTETLANIYIKQKHYDKAINIFEKLRLKYPEKSVYFANRISEIEK